MTDPERPAPMTPEEEDRELEAFLARDSRTSAAWKDTQDAVQTPPELDAAVIAHARAAVETTPVAPSLTIPAMTRPAESPYAAHRRLRRWRVPLAAAATLVFGVVLVGQWMRDPVARQQVVPVELLPPPPPAAEPQAKDEASPGALAAGGVASSTSAPSADAAATQPAPPRVVPKSVPPAATPAGPSKQKAADPGDAKSRTTSAASANVAEDDAVAANPAGAAESRERYAPKPQASSAAREMPPPASSPQAFPAPAPAPAPVATPSKATPPAPPVIPNAPIATTAPARAPATPPASVNAAESSGFAGVAAASSAPSSKPEAERTDVGGSADADAPADRATPVTSRRARMALQATPPAWRPARWQTLTLGSSAVSQLIERLGPPDEDTDAARSGLRLLRWDHAADARGVTSVYVDPARAVVIEVRLALRPAASLGSVLTSEHLEGLSPRLQQPAARGCSAATPVVPGAQLDPTRYPLDFVYPERGVVLSLPRAGIVSEITWLERCE